MKEKKKYFEVKKMWKYKKTSMKKAEKRKRNVID